MKLKVRKFSLSLLLMFNMLCMFSAHAPPKRRLEGTPETGTSHVVVDLTPGKKITQELTFLSLQKLRETLPEGMFEQLDERFKERGGLAILSDTSVEYDNADKFFVLRMLFHDVEKRALKAPSTPLDDMYNQLLRVFRKTNIAALDRVKFKTTEFFQQLHPDGRIAIYDKQSGVQLGCIAVVTEPSNKTFKYYVKTHSYGLLQSKTTPAKRVSALELLAYKILEITGLGCKSYFFGRNELDCYIATLDAGHEGTFLIYDKLKAKLPKTLAGCQTFFEQDCEAKTIGYEIAKLDLLVRVLKLTDLQTNSNNFGFVTIDGKKKIKAIDFRMPEIKDLKELRAIDGSFESLMDGNGEYYYTDAFMRILLSPESPFGKIDTLKLVFKEFSLLENMITEAHQSFLADLPQLISDAEIVSLMTGQINQVVQIFIANFNLFKRLFSQHLKTINHVS